MSVVHQPDLLSWLALQLVARLSIGRILVAVTAFVVAAFVVECLLQPRCPSSLPRVGHGSGPLALQKVCPRFAFHDELILTSQYAKSGRAFVVPSGISRPQDIIIPPSQTAWMFSLPEHVLSADASHDDTLFTEYNMLNPDGSHVMPVVFHNHVIHRNLFRHMPVLLPSIEKEVAAAVDLAFGGPDATAWHSVNVWKALLAIISRVSNLIIVGEAACRDQRMLDNAIGFADAVVYNNMLLSLLPAVVQPIAGRLLGRANRRRWQAVDDVIGPIIRQRLQDIAQGRPVPEDYLTWHIRTATAEGHTFELSPMVVSQSVMPLEFATIHTTVISAHSLLLDLFSSSQTPEYVETIRQEVATLRAESPGPWTKPQLARMWYADSAIRESMRVSSFVVSPIKRKVVAPEGVTNPIEGWHVPFGSYFMINQIGVHHDGDIYGDPNGYDAFRYARQREAAVQAGHSASPFGMITTTEQYLAFGHGRHAWYVLPSTVPGGTLANPSSPGRFFVAYELKMIMAYLLTNYEIKPLAERKQPRWVGQFIVPPVDVNLEVRRRQKA